MITYFICSFINVFIHVIKTLLIVNAGKRYQVFAILSVTHFPLLW